MAHISGRMSNVIATFLFVGCFYTVVHAQHVEQFYRSPDAQDSALVLENTNLINANLTKENEENYYSVAKALWELKRNDEAKGMFRNIVQSEYSKYTQSYYHGSDIPGDTTTNIYGYGSFTSNYKNSACLYLAKIFIEDQKFEDAHQYLVAADKKHQVQYNCGTGNNMYRERMRNLYGLCYEGLNKNEKAIDLLLPFCFDWGNHTLFRILNANYSKDQRIEYIKTALNSITCEVDTFESKSYRTTNWNKETEISTELTYISGSGTIQLFERRIKLPTPRLEDGDTITRQYFVDQFMASELYQSMTNDYSHSRWELPKLQLDGE